MSRNVPAAFVGSIEVSVSPGFAIGGSVILGIVGITVEGSSTISYIATILDIIRGNGVCSR